MADNDYYNRTATYARGTTGRGNTLEGSLDGVKAGFDLLPTLADFQTGLVTYVTTAGSANTYTATITKVTDYSSVFSALLEINHTNTGVSTLNVNGLGAVAIKRSDLSDLQGDDLVSGAVVQVVYNLTYFVVISSDPSLVAQAQASATAAASSATDSATSASASASSASTSSTQATNSANSATASATSAALAEDWAEELEDVEVTTGKYSALHWAAKALTAVTGVTSVNTRTGAVTLASSDVGLGNCDNTADSAKPVSTAQQTALDLKANLASPTLTGTPIAPTASAGTGTTQIATCEFVLDNVISYILIEQQEAAGTAGGSATALTWNTRGLNTEVYDPGGHASVATDQVTLAAGTYVFQAYGQAYRINNHKLRLANIDDTSYIYGVDSRADSASDNPITAIVSGYFTIATSKTFELQHYSTTARTTTGLGLSTSLGTHETYAGLQLWKIA